MAIFIGEIATDNVGIYSSPSLQAVKWQLHEIGCVDPILVCIHFQMIVMNMVCVVFVL